MAWLRDKFAVGSMVAEDRSQPNADLVDPQAGRRAGIGTGNYLGLIYRNFFSNRYMKVELFYLLFSEQKACGDILAQAAQFR